MGRPSLTCCRCGLDLVEDVDQPVESGVITWVRIVLTSSSLKKIMSLLQVRLELGEQVTHVLHAAVLAVDRDLSHSRPRESGSNLIRMRCIGVRSAGSDAEVLIDNQLPDCRDPDPVVDVAASVGDLDRWCEHCSFHIIDTAYGAFGDLVTVAVEGLYVRGELRGRCRGLPALGVPFVIRPEVHAAQVDGRIEHVAVLAALALAHRDEVGPCLTSVLIFVLS